MKARRIPGRPKLQHYEEEAKDLLNACVSGDKDGIRLWAERWVEAHAHECVETAARLRGLAPIPHLRDLILREEVDGIEKRIRAGKLSEADPTLADAQFFVAQEHGFESWPNFVNHVQALQQGNTSEANFEVAADAIASGDVETLRALLRTDPELIRMRSPRIHHAPLLHYIAANGVEDFRQITPKNIVEITRVLLDAGADVSAESDAYSGGCTALGLLATSVHPERAGVQETLMQILLDYGAEIDKPDAAGNRHTAVEGCLANGRGQAARFLASRGAVLNLETAAGAGKLDTVKTFFRADGRLAPPATQKQLQRGFLWAAMYGRQEIVAFLLDRGADVRDQSETGASALHWAAAGAHLSIVQLLIQREAPLEELNRWGGTVLEHAGWAFANGDAGTDYVPIFEALLAAGAKVRDGWLSWLQQQSGRSDDAKARVAKLISKSKHVKR